MPRDMVSYTVTLHANGAITYSDPVDIQWKTAEEEEE